MGYYKTASVCLNGHINSNDVSSYNNNANYCSKCGSQLIITCPNCDASIHGKYEVEGVISFSTGPENPDAYCYNCGKPYPWTESAIKATQELLALDSSEDSKYLQDNINALLIDTPKTKVVSTRMKIFLSKTSSELASGVRDVLVDIISETARKAIFGN